jgi:ferredoxin-nitrate reductase
VAHETRTLCPYCGVGCGLVARTEGDRLVEVAGDPIYPVNRGRTCRKPLELPASVHARDRALTPLWRAQRDVRFKPRSWDHALGTLAARLAAIRERHGPDSIAFYISGQLLTEDYYVVNKLVKGFLQTNNVDSNSRLCMSSAVSGYNGAFGADGPPPSYADLELADCLLLVGSNAAACHPIVWGRIRNRQREGAFVICADPRATPTALQSDLHLPLRAGTDLALLNALLHVVLRDGLVDEPFVRSRTNGFEAAAAVASEWPPERAASVCGVAIEAIEVAASRFGRAPRAMALWSMGANQSTVGTLKNRAIINLCLATGQIGRPGAGPLSLTGQPNAMGGRETGGLAHLLPGYRRVQSSEERLEMERFWACPPLSPEPGLRAVELFDALAEGRVKAVWIVATNPIVSLPDGARAREALERAELVVVQDAFHPTETSALAHAVLPAAAWPEKSGAMTNSERRVGLVRAALAPPGDALPDWRIFARLAAELGHGEHFAWEREADVFDEFAACTAGRPCDITGLSHERLLREGGIQWPCPVSTAGPADAADGTERLYADRRFHTPDGRARFAATPHAEPIEKPTLDFPLVLTTGRVADHWHTMTRTGKSLVLTTAAGEPALELNPADARESGVGDGDRARLVSARGSAILRIRISDAVPRGLAFAPMHWGALHAPPGSGVVNLITHGAADPTSGQPELKAAAVRVERVESSRRSFTRSRSPRQLVVVGAGMAGLAVVEEVLRRRPGEAWGITMLGEEPDGPYNRILLSKLLARTCGAEELELRPAGWYAEQGIHLRGGSAAVELDPAHRVVVAADGLRHAYDALVLATGSRAFLPQIDGAELPHVHRFRTQRDADEIAASTVAARAAVVVGGGLLGLEAAAGLLARGLPVTVVELADHVMPQQLDPGAAWLLARALEQIGVRLRLGRSVRAITATEVVLDDGEHLEAGAVVVAAGVRAETSLARAAGIEVGRGILVDDELRCSAPSVWAVGECAEHRGIVSGLWAPIAEQARVAGAALAGDPAGFQGLTPATTLKVAGVELFAGGAACAAPGQDEIVFSDTRRGEYRKLVLDGTRLAGALLVGDTSHARTLSELLRTGAPVPGPLLEPELAGRPAQPDLAADDSALVCSCNAVSRGEIVSAIRARSLTTVVGVGRATRAATGCGGCAADIEAILASLVGSSDRNTDGTGGKRVGATIAA